MALCMCCAIISDAGRHVIPHWEKLELSGLLQELALANKATVYLQQYSKQGSTKQGYGVMAW